MFLLDPTFTKFCLPNQVEKVKVRYCGSLAYFTGALCLGLRTEECRTLTTTCILFLAALLDMYSSEHLQGPQQAWTLHVRQYRIWLWHTRLFNQNCWSRQKWYASLQLSPVRQGNLGYQETWTRCDRKDHTSEGTHAKIYFMGCYNVARRWRSFHLLHGQYYRLVRRCFEEAMDQVLWMMHALRISLK